MTQLNYRIELHNGESYLGAVKAGEGECRVALPLHGTLRAVTATMRLDTAAGEKIFMNGFQSWTWCPEYRYDDRIRSLRALPKKGVEHFGVDRYGDYYFVDYPDKKGVTHGESYCYFRKGEKFRLIASLDETPGYTLFCYDAFRGELTLRRDCEGLAVDGDFHAFDLFFAEGGEDEVFDAWFAAMAVGCRTKEKIAGYSSWYNRYENISAQTISEDLAGCAEVLQPGDVFQIDDGWEENVGDWLDTDRSKFPEGLKGIADEIHARGLRAGLWLAPFAANRRSCLYRRHPDWFFRHNGERWHCGMNWGGFYALDFDHPEVREYLRAVFSRVLDDWGFDLVKLDFLYAAAPFGSACESRAGRMRRAMEFLRQLCGDKLILGCGVPLMPAFGLVDYCRVSCDVSLDWNGSRLMQRTNRERPSTRQAIGNSIFRRQLNGRAWLSDPDVFFLRENNLRLSRAEKRALATVNSLFGGVLLHSDDMADWSGEARAFYRQLLRNRDAEKIRVYQEKGLVLHYELDGQRHICRIEEP